MTKRYVRKIVCSGLILASCCIWILRFAASDVSDNQKWRVIGLAVAIAAVVFVKGIIRWKRCRKKPMQIPQTKIYELLLLDENDKSVRGWKLSGKTSWIIGRQHQEKEVDVDLGNCEYVALIDFQHAMLNFKRNSWYLKDMNSHNGIRIKKADNGACYQVKKNRPCCVETGDIIYIANIRLLLT